MKTITEKSLVCLSFGFVLALCFAVTVSAQTQPPPTNRLETGGNYNIAPPPTNMMFRVTNNDTNAGDDNLVWSHSGRMIAADRSDPTVTNGSSQKYICLLDVRNLGNVQTLGARSSAATNPVYCNITDWTWNDDRVLFGWQPEVPEMLPRRLMSCTATGPVSVATFLAAPQETMTDVFAPSVVYDPAVSKERLLFLVSSGQGAPGATVDPVAPRINLGTVTFNHGGVPNWADRVQLTAFSTNWSVNTNLSISSAKWCPELGTNYQPICNRLVILLTGGMGQGEQTQIIVLNGVQDIIADPTTAPTNLSDPRFVLLETNCSQSSQVSWTYDGQYVMYGRMSGPSELYSKRADSPTNPAVKFETPSSIAGGQKQWLSISPDGMKAAFTVDHKVYVIPMQFDNVAVTGVVVTNVLTDASYTAIDVPGDAIPSNTIFSIVAPPTVDTNNFNSEFSGYAREISASGVSSQFDLLTNATMTLHFSEADIPEGVSATNLAVYVYNPEGTGGQTGTWDKLDSVIDTNKMTIACEVEHFSIYAIGRASVQPVRVVLADPAIVDSAGNWYVWFSGSGYQRGGPWNLGVAGTPAAADFDGDHYTDCAIVDSTGAWRVWFTSQGYQMGGPWSMGVSGTPVAADFDGDLYGDPAVVDSNDAWYFWCTSQGYQMVGPYYFLGGSGTPLAADFDGDLYADPAMVDSAGVWYAWFSSLAYRVGGPYSLGVLGMPVAADYDGDGYADPAVVDSAGAWRIWYTSLGYQMGGPYSLGVSGTPVPADFDGR